MKGAAPSRCRRAPNRAPITRILDQRWDDIPVCCRDGQTAPGEHVVANVENRFRGHVDAQKRDRLLLLLAVAHTLLTLLGATSEESGLDRALKTNTSKRQPLSLFNQGLLWYCAMAHQLLAQSSSSCC